MQLIINKRGAKLSVENGMYRICAADLTQLVSVSQVQSIVLCPSTSLTYDAIELAIKNDCDIVLQSSSGQPIGRIWSNRFGSIAGLRKKQLEFCQSVASSEWIRNNILERIQTMESMVTITCNLSKRDPENITQAFLKIRNNIQTLQCEPQQGFFASLRGWEGQATKAYFKELSSCLPEQYRFKKRSQHPAADMFNALLNYGYGMLYARVEWALIHAGLDPFLGIMHRDEYNKAVLTFDVIESFRVWVDFPVFQLCLQNLVFPEFFEVKNNSWWLKEEIKRILARSINDYLEEVIEMNGQSRSRLVHIKWHCQALANSIKNNNNN